MEENARKELIRKYRWAGKIRFVSFLLLFLFLLLMKASGGYSYLNVAFISLILVEAVVNQPYTFFLKNVDIRRFQFYQMITDIIAVSWIVYYMGGVEAPVVSIAYYAVILWAGAVSGPQAVFFAVSASCISFSSVIVLEHFRMLPPVAYFNDRVPAAQMFGLLFGNTAFMFAFGYFSMHSSEIIRSLEKKRQEESLRYTHRLLAAGYLLEGITHDIVNHLAGVRGYAMLLLEQIGNGTNKKEGMDSAKVLEKIKELESENIELLSKLSRFSRKHQENRAPTDLNRTIADAAELTAPLARMSNVAVNKIAGENLPLVMADRDQMQEVFVALLLNSIEATPKKGTVTIKTLCPAKSNYAETTVSYPGSGMGQDYLKKISEPFFTAKGLREEASLGFTIAREIVTRHNGTMDIESPPDKGTTVIIRLPVRRGP